MLQCIGCFMVVGSGGWLDVEGCIGQVCLGDERGGCRDRRRLNGVVRGIVVLMVIVVIVGWGGLRGRGCLERLDFGILMICILLGA